MPQLNDILVRTVFGLQLNSKRRVDAAAVGNFATPPLVAKKIRRAAAVDLKIALRRRRPNIHRRRGLV